MWVSLLIPKKQKEILRAFEDVNKALSLNPRHKEALEIKKFLL